MKREATWLGIIPVILLCLSAIVIAASPTFTASLQYHRDDILDGRWYLMLTGHLTHFGGSHLWWDVIALLALGITAGRREPRKAAWTIAAAIVVIPVALLILLPDLVVYRGLSGVCAAMFGLLLVSLARDAGPRFRVLLLAGLAAFIAKLVYETATGHAFFVDSDTAGFVPVPIAHLAGLVTGLAVAMLPRIQLSPRRSGVPVALVLLACSQTGCLTRQMWKRGVATELHNPEVVSAAANGAVVIQYGEANDTSHVMLPLDRQDQVIEPLRYTGSGRSLLAIEQDVPAKQIRDVNRTVLPSAGWYFGHGSTPPAKGADARGGVPSEKLGIEIFAFDAAGDPVGDVVRLNSGKTGARFPDDCRIFLLPKTQPRDAGPVLLDTFVLVISTPVTLAVDLVFTPVTLISRTHVN
jgi:rhomboid family GlyGly-CTERM serine protease